MTRTLMAVCITFLPFGCSNAQSSNSVHIFIPMNYTGWVNLVFNDSSSVVEPLTFSNGYVI